MLAPAAAVAVRRFIAWQDEQEAQYDTRTGLPYNALTSTFERRCKL